jgi:cellulose synthase/poly-beta-1,6-N-acetylglucosamine synthase-like glycosyltransferase
MAMLSRHFRPWLTSGACFAGRTESLRQIYAKNSMWTPGEDIETGRVAHALKMKIRHCDIVVRTEAPDTWRGLFRQRKLWWAGNFRHWAINADKNLLHMPIMSCYSLLAVWISFYFKWWSMIDWHELPYTLPMLWFAYVAITFLANTQVRSRWMLLFPFYSLLQTTIMPPLGVITYLLLLRKRGYAGRYRFGYERRRPLPPLPPQAG